MSTTPSTRRALLSLGGVAAALAVAAVPSVAAAQQDMPMGRERRSGMRRTGMQRGGGDAQNAEVDRLNQMSLERARGGMNSPTPGPDTTQNLNRMSEDAARSGRNMNQAPMPFR